MISKTGNRPMKPRSQLAGIVPTPMDAEAVKAAGWNDHRILVVDLADARLNWLDRKAIENIGDKLYGK